MAKFLENCPILKNCFYCKIKSVRFQIGLKTGVFFTILLGFTWAVAWFYAYTDKGIGFFQNKIPDEVVPGLKILHLMLGIFMFISHVILTVAVFFYEKEIMFTVYIWMMITIWVVIGLQTVTVGMSLAIKESFEIMKTYGPMVYTPWIIYVYLIFIVGNYRTSLRKTDTE